MDETRQDRDINVRAVTRFGIGLAGSLVLVAFLMWFLFDRFVTRQKPTSRQLEPMAAINPRKEPPEPRLQKDPEMDLKELRAGEEAILHNYGWIDPDKGVVRIPVERAMELVAKEGLPSR